MHISWLGTTAIKIQTKPFDKEVMVVIDPYKSTLGSFPRSLSPEIGLFTRGEDNSITLSGQPFILSTSGECETKGVLITATSGHESNRIMLRIDVEQISLGHLGLVNKELNDQQLEVLSEVDILFIPVGGQGCYEAEKAVKVVNAIEPRIIIPMAYKSDNDPKADKVETFLKELGIANGKPEKKVIIKRKDIPQEEMKVIVLSKE